MNNKIIITENILELIPEGDSCSDENGICPYWIPLTKDGNEITRARCSLIDYEEKKDFQGTFLWGMLKICNLKNENK